MALTVADFVADGQIFCVTGSTFAERPDMFQRSGLCRNVFATHPAGHLPVKLPGDYLIDFVANKGQSAHAAAACKALLAKCKFT